MQSTAASRSSTRPVTVVVPLFDHWHSLELCLRALIAHVDTSIHRVILVNDCGPNADELERQVLEVIEGHENFFYYRNERNLGFVQTCNRAVLELDPTGNDVLLLNSDAELSAGALEELVDVLYSGEHHGMVCPRSDQASIATIPYFRREGSVADGDRSAHVFEHVSPLLPRYYLSPVSIGFCYLVRRSLIDNHGLFDSVYGLGYNEENDLCMRVNALGYSSLIANHAFVKHLGSASFAPEVKAELDDRNFRILLDRYPHYMEAVYSFLDYGYAAADIFADIVAPPTSNERSILIDIHHLSLVYNGSTRYALSFLRSLASITLPPGVRVVVAAQRDAIGFFGLDRYGLTVVGYRELTGVFDVGVALAPVNHIDQLFHLNRHAARWVVSHFDMIASRSWALMLGDPLRPLAVEYGLRHADRVVAISNFSLADAAAFYPRLANRLAETGEAIALGSTRDAAIARGEDPFDSPIPPEVERVIGASTYIVIAGNFYPHKQVGKSLQALEALGLPIIAFGPLADEPTSDSTVVLTSGVLSDAHMERIMANAALVVFPSAYEGFGLPIADALDYGVPVVAFDTAVAREVVDTLGASEAVRFFARFSDLPGIVTSALADAELHRVAHSMKEQVRGLGPFNRRLVEIALGLVDEPIDVGALTVRFEEIKRLQRVAGMRRGEADDLRRELRSTREAIDAVLSSESYRVGNVFARLGGPLLRAIRSRRGEPR